MTPVDGVRRVGTITAELGEGPVWDGATGSLVWVDILAGLVHRHAPSTGLTDTLEVGRPVGAVALRAGGGLVLATDDGFRFIEAGGTTSRLVAPINADDPELRMNDGKCDPLGRFWAGTMRYDQRAGGGALYCLGSDATVTLEIKDVTISNGIDWSPDGRTMYFIDTPTQRVDAFDFDPAGGRISARRSLISIDPADGGPDGLTVDADGYVWVALWGGWSVRRYTPEGRPEREIRLPAAHVTSLAFGGAHLDELFITTAWEGLATEQRAAQPEAGGLFHCRPGVRGRPARSFAG